jgi:hypothetical protein
MQHAQPPFPLRRQPAANVVGRAPGPCIDRQYAVKAVGRLIAALARALLQRRLDYARYVEKSYFLAEKCADSDFIRGIQDRRGEPTAPQAIERDIETGKALMRRLLKLQLAERSEIELS